MTVYAEITRIWHVPAKHANRMDARAHSSTLAEFLKKIVNRRLDLRGLYAKVRRNWHKCRATFRGEPVFLELRYFAAFGRES